MTTPRARRTDPNPSHQAARQVIDQDGTRARVLALLTEHGPLTDAELITKHRHREGTAGWPYASESGLRSRRAELVRDGLVDAGVLRDDRDGMLEGPFPRRTYPNGPERIRIVITPLTTDELGAPVAADQEVTIA